jgi:hypothetical protein
VKVYRIRHTKIDSEIVEIEAKDAKEACHRAQHGEGDILPEHHERVHKYQVLNDYENDNEPEV